MGRSFKKFVIGVLVALTLAACGAMAGENGGAVGDNGGAVSCPLVDAADMTAITLERANLLVGFTESDLESCGASLGWAFRVGERDGEGFALTADYSLQRVTVSVTKNSRGV